MIPTQAIHAENLRLSYVWSVSMQAMHAEKSCLSSTRYTAFPEKHKTKNMRKRIIDFIFISGRLSPGVFKHCNSVWNFNFRHRCWTSQSARNLQGDMPYLMQETATRL